MPCFLDVATVPPFLQHRCRCRFFFHTFTNVASAAINSHWDVNIRESDFSVIYNDRVNNSIVETPLDAPNHSIQGKATQLIDALPEHRICAVKYKERMVWDRQGRLDLVFGEPGIAHVIATYDEWKCQQEQEEAWNRQRETTLLMSLQRLLGLERYQRLESKNCSETIAAHVGRILEW